MGDEHGAPRPEAGRGRDPDADRTAAPAATAIGGSDGRGDPTRPEAAGVAPFAGGGTDDGAGLGLGPTAPTKTASTSSGEAAEKLTDLEFHALRAIRYHEARGTFLDLWRRLLDFSVILLGAGAITSLFAEGRGWAAALNIATAAIGAVQLVANLGDRAQEHRWLRRKFCDLLARVTEAKLEPEIAPRALRKLTKRWADLWGEEVSTMHVLEAVAYNATVRSLSAKVEEDDLIVIGPWQSMTRNVFSWEGFRALTPRDIREAQAKREADRAH